jgi:hypothetical protein
MNFCLNRPTHLTEIKKPLFEKPDEKPPVYEESLHQSQEFMGI